MRSDQWLTGAGLLLAATATTAATAVPCASANSVARFQVIELYTSEGCSSCPPAERWLNGLDDPAGRIALAFHVDYWDDLGWPDRFANARFSARQRQLAPLGGSGSVYTPGVRVDGIEQRWTRSLAAPAATASGTLQLHAEVNAAQLQATLQTSPATWPDSARVFLAVTENGLQTHVRAGENVGSVLQHDHVVRAFADPQPITAGVTSIQLSLPADLRLRHAQLVAVVEDHRSGRTLAAVAAPLASCAR